MAFAAGNPSMGTLQGKLRLGMVKSPDIDPGFDGVACLAAKRCSVGAFGRHAILKLALMRIHVAGGAGHIVKMEWQNFVCSAGEPHLVAIRASHGNVSTRQHETSVLVLGDGKC